MDLTGTGLYDILIEQGFFTNEYQNEHGLIRFAEAETNDAMWLTPSMRDNIAKARNRTVYIPAIKPGSITVETTPSFNIPLNYSDTEKKSVTIYTLFSGFNYNPYDFRDNAIKEAEYVAAKMREIDEAMADSKSDIIETFLNTNRTQVLSGAANVGLTTGDFNFNTSTDLLEIKLAAQRDVMFADMKTIFRTNKRKADLRYVASPEMETVLTQLAKYGLYNEKNIQNQGLLPEVFYDHNIDNSVRFTGFATVKGSMAMVTNVLDEYVNGELTGNGWKFSVSDMAMPMLGIAPMMLTRRNSSDNSSFGNDAAGNTSVKQEIGILHRFGLISSYNDDLTTKVADKVKITGLNS